MGRPRSIQLAVSTIYSVAETAAKPLKREEILTTLAEIGIRRNCLSALEIANTNTVHVVFANFEGRNKFLEKTINVRPKNITLHYPSPQFNRDTGRRLTRLCESSAIPLTLMTGTNIPTIREVSAQDLCDGGRLQPRHRRTQGDYGANERCVLLHLCRATSGPCVLPTPTSNVPKMPPNREHGP